MLLHRWIDKPLDNDIIQYHDALDEKGRAPNSQVETGVPTLLKVENDEEKPAPHKSVRFG